MTNRRYLVAWGGDKRSADALKLGGVLASTFGAGLDLVYVVHREGQLQSQYAGERDFESHVAQQAKGWLAEARAQLPAELDVATHVYRAGSIGGGILEAARDLNSTCIVIGAGTGSRRPVTSNPIVSSLLHASPVPVAMAPRSYRRKDLTKLTSLTCAVGTRPGAHQVIEEAVESAQRGGIELRFLSLVDLSGDRASDEQRADARGALEQAQRQVAQKYPSTIEMAEGKSIRQAVRRVKWDPASAVLIGSSRLANRHTTFLGSAAARMIAVLPVPMVIVPRPGEEVPST